MTSWDIALTGFMLTVLLFLAVCAVASIRDWREELRREREHEAWRRAAELRRYGY